MLFTVLMREMGIRKIMWPPKILWPVSGERDMNWGSHPFICSPGNFLAARCELCSVLVNQLLLTKPMTLRPSWASELPENLLKIQTPCQGRWGTVRVFLTNLPGDLFAYAFIDHLALSSHNQLEMVLNSHGCFCCCFLSLFSYLFHEQETKKERQIPSVPMSWSTPSLRQPGSQAWGHIPAI